MAGSYPDYPGRRMAYDADATVVVGVPSTGLNFEPSQAVLDIWNDEDAQGTQTQQSDEGFVFIFPELREIDGIVQQRRRAGATISVETSEDTTNGQDGTFGQIATGLPQHISNGTGQEWRPEHRTEITSLADANIRGLWLRSNYSGASTQNKLLEHVHIFGEISAGETPDRLLFIDEATGLDFTSARDYGNVPRGSSEDSEWRIKNNSASLTATTIQYSTEDLFLNAASWFTHTLPGGSTYQATQSVTSLAATTTSGLIKTRRITAADATPDHYAARTFLDVGTWP